MKSLPWNAGLLALVQPFVLSVGALSVFLGGIVGAQLQPTLELATLPVTVLIIGVSLNIFPAAKIQHRFGRKNAFIAAALISSGVAFAAGIAIEQEAFWAFTACSFLLGTQLAYVSQYRFAAIESCKDPSQHPSVVSLVLVGGIAAAVVGPELLNVGQLVPVFTSEYANAYSALGIIELIGALILLIGMKPISIREDSTTNGSDRPLSQVLKQPLLWLALGAGLTAYAVMAFLMTATPLAMQHHGHDIQSAKWVIQSHVVAMYLPSLITPLIIRRIGTFRLIFVGCMIMLGCIAIGLLGQSVHSYWWALVLLGIGWNFLFISGTTLLPGTYQPNERFRVQAINDFSITAFQAAGSLSAGMVLFTQGWSWMLVASVFPIITLLLLNIVVKKH
ncbi:MFS transporter [Photobacterium alginatilyticum]|uniref:MFS transporter n=1 Tax=Photobacterium alginatilyticum TaxID=1775171 RepID=A0ABW9YD69_9GAMM|nr:MFS transporter [Photobacterium alginatilyticum]NBI51717.1 MFS transporter [Photobacterium alginatilyticum]